MINDNKDVVISLRIRKSDKRWIDRHRINAGILFRRALWKAKSDGKVLGLEREMENSVKKVFVVCSKCGVVHFGKKSDLDKGNRDCARCSGKKK